MPFIPDAVTVRDGLMGLFAAFSALSYRKMGKFKNGQGEELIRATATLSRHSERITALEVDNVELQRRVLVLEAARGRGSHA